MSERIDCPGCGKNVSVTGSGKYWAHGGGDCDFAGTLIPEEGGCSVSNTTAASPTASSAMSPADDAKDNAGPAICSTPSSPSTPEEEAAASTTAPADGALPGGVVFSQPAPTDEVPLVEIRMPVGPVTFTPPEGAVAKPPPPAFAQPAGRKSEAPAVGMSELGKEITARFKEIFYSYNNRRSADNRSAQTTMGPSGMGSPCDRRLAAELMKMPPVSPGGDGFAAFVGTCIHAGLEEMFKWADAGTGRFATESRVEFTSKYVPKGTADLLDRTLFCLEDFKCQGRWSRNKLKSQGPSQTYRVQAHVYAHGARLRGEKVERVAIVSVPRDEATLDDLYVWVEEYRPDIVKEAFERIERIGDQVAHLVDADVPTKALKLAEFDVADDCRFCSAYMPNARSITDGCNGKR